MLWTVDKFALYSNSCSGKLCTMLQLMLWTSMHYAICNSCSGKLCIMLQFRLWTSICTFYCSSCSVQWTSLHYAAIHALENYSLCCNSCSEQVCTMQQFMLLRSSTMQHFRLSISMHYAAINALDNYALQYAAILSCYSPTVGSQTPYTVLTPAVRTNCGD